ncbi:MAG TPA: NAD(P)/FAD-dependent oxidoreductase [Steroidobacteraceae bacterium]|jgi:monoamine oxidase
MPDFDTIVVGAGMAGLSAARLLAEAGRRVALVEARARIGGRILTERVPSAAGRLLPLELGAEFIHGLPMDSWNLIHEANLATEERGGSQFCWEQEKLGPCGGPFKSSFKILESLPAWLGAQPAGTDMPFSDYLTLAGVSADEAHSAIAYVEGFNAADSRKIGVAALARQQSAEDAIDSERIFHLKQGYDGLPRFLLEKFQRSGGSLFLDHPVSKLEWQRGSVRIWAHEGKTTLSLTAEQAIVTIPLGVLQSGAVEFLPAIRQLDDNAGRLAMGSALRMSLLFDRKFWEERAPGMSFLHSLGLLVPTWWSPEPDPAPVLTAWIAGAAAIGRFAPLVRQGHRQACSAVLDTLAQVFALPAASLQQWLVSSHLHDWQSDAYSRGSYSYAPAGALDASRALAQPVEHTIYFAGEHTDDQGHWGTVHAAIASGVRAAEQLVTA